MYIRMDRDTYKRVIAAGVWDWGKLLSKYEGATPVDGGGPCKLHWAKTLNHRMALGALLAALDDLERVRGEELTHGVIPYADALADIMDKRLLTPAEAVNWLSETLRK